MCRCNERRQKSHASRICLRVVCTFNTERGEGGVLAHGMVDKPLMLVLSCPGRGERARRQETSRANTGVVLGCGGEGVRIQARA